MVLTLFILIFEHRYNETVANQTFRRIFRNSNFFETHVHLGTLTFQKNLNHKNFLENFNLRHLIIYNSRCSGLFNQPIWQQI